MKSKKILIMKTRPGISDDEIQSMMDFNKVLEAHRSAQAKGKLLLSAGVAGGVVVLSLIAWQLMKSPEQKQVVEEQIQRPQQEIVQDSTSVSREPIVVKEEKKPDPARKETKKESDDTRQPAAAAPAPVYTEAEPVNGYPELYAWFQKELKYPVEAEKDSIEGIVSVSFVINKDGKPEQIRIMKTLGKPFDDEVVRVITNMPEWKPASLNGNRVPAKISMPLTFQINRSQKQ
jgi:TonB family protein